MTAARKSLVNEKLASADFPSGFDVHIGRENFRRIKLRRALNRTNPLGVTIMSRHENQLSRVEQFDISPKLDPRMRGEVEALIVQAYLELASPESFEKGLARLNKLHREGKCVSCDFRPIK